MKRERFSDESVKIYTVDNDRRAGWIISKILSTEGFSLQHFESGPALLAQLEKEGVPDLIITDFRMPGMDGMALTREIQAKYPHVPVIVMTAYGTVESAVQAMKAGAADFITKPFKPKELKEIVKRLLKSAIRPPNGPDLPGSSLDGEVQLVGNSPVFREPLELVRKIAPMDITVLLRGESGTGKELFARKIHELSHRRRFPFVAIDCATLPETLMESELFGHEKGAFTDAKNMRIGKFEQADKGTLFLDEIGNLSLSSQMKILRAIQERTIERLGSRKLRKIDVRIVAATNVNLENAMREGRFREDLYYRLNEISIWIPSLRERMEDIPLIAHHYLHVFNREFNRNVKGIQDDVMEIFRSYTWPGNVRELRNVMKRAVILAGDTITLNELPVEIIRSAERETPQHREIEVDLKKGLDLKELARMELQRIEEKIILKTLKMTNWHLSKTAQILGVDRKTLRNKMKSFGIQKERRTP